MQLRWRVAFALLAACCLVGCKGAITSPEPLITLANAAYPLPATATVEALTLNEDHVWESNEGKARLTLVDGSYRVTDPDAAAPSTDSYLFKRIRDGVFIVQASNGREWAYGLIVHADIYYLYTFNLAGQQCTNLSSVELRRFNVTIQDEGCTVSSVADLSGLLQHLRRSFVYPTSAFTIR